MGEGARPDQERRANRRAVPAPHRRCAAEGSGAEPRETAMSRIDPAVFGREVYALHPDTLLGSGGDLPGAVLVVAKDRIAAVGLPADLPPQYRDVEIVRLEKCAIVPGFLDVHHHVIEPFAKALTAGEPAQIWKRIWM